MEVSKRAAIDQSAEYSIDHALARGEEAAGA